MMYEAATVQTNLFRVTSYPQSLYFQYDVSITQPYRPKTADSENGLAPRRAHEVIDRMQSTYPQYFTPRASFDGRSNLFSKKDLNITTFTVQLPSTPEKSVFSVVLTKVLAIDPNNIRKLISRAPRTEQTVAQTPTTEQATIEHTTINLLQILIRQAPNKKHSYPPHSRAFFIQDTVVSLPTCRFLQAIRGYIQSVRPAVNNLLVNVDVVHAAVWQSGPLINLAMNVLGVNDIRQLERLQDEPRAWKKLSDTLKNISITVETSPDGKPRSIRKLETRASAYEFDREGFGVTTVENYFRDVYNRVVRHRNLFTVRIGQRNVIPAEFCFVVPGQMYRKKLPPRDQDEFLKYTQQRPHERLRRITNVISGSGQQLDWGTSDVMREAGMNIDTSPMKVDGHIWSPPQILYGDGAKDISGSPGKWNVLGRKFFRPGTVKCWAVVCFEPKFTYDQARILAGKLQHNLSMLGANFVTRGPVLIQGNPQQVDTSLGDGAKAACKAAGADRPTFILVILPAFAAEIRKSVKLWGDIVHAIPTQCVRMGKIERVNDQYLNNVALKINAKIGGVNSATMYSSSPQADQYIEDAMIVGADVSHPGPGVKNRPSVTSLVASVNTKATVYTSFVNVQRPRFEIIEDLKDMMLKALRDYAAYRQRPGSPPTYPAKVIFYRDGVSEGEFQIVLNVEAKAVEMAFAELGIEPKLMFIVVGKRHHIRFFPLKPEHTDRSGNCTAGFAVDSQITHPVYEDFYLQSHAGIIGTSRPAHYTVLRNDDALTIKQLQALSFKLCHLYASATTSVSIPAPVYYADRLCARADFHILEEGLHLSDDGTTASSDSTTFNLADWKKAFKPSSLNRMMYFL